jgi:hypothetical protein
LTAFPAVVAFLPRSWLIANIDRVEELFANQAIASRSCEALIAIQENKSRQTVRAGLWTLIGKI